MKVGLVGLGNMGGRMGARLIELGHQLTIYDILNEAMVPLIKLGAQGTSSPEEVASLVDMVLVSLPTPESVKTVALGPGGLVNGSAIKVYVDMSTTGLAVSLMVAGELGKKGISVLDAPVSGGFLAVEKGDLTIMASGHRPVFESLLPILNGLGKNIIYVGEKPGMGQTMKLVNNLVADATLAVTSEALVLGTKGGLDPEVMLKVLNTSGGRSATSEIKIPKAVLTRTFNLGFTNDLAYKDLSLALELADQLGVSTIVGRAAHQLWEQCLETGGGSADYSSIIKQVEASAGIEVPKSR